jgi:hypothetical protein
VTIQDLQEDAQDFLDYYIQGAATPAGQRGFPGSNFAGIQFRAPAVVGVRPEYTPLPDPLDGTVVLAGNDGPEGIGPYLFLDRCPLRKAVVTLANGTVMVELVVVVQYPPGRFPDSTVNGSTEIRLPSNSFNRLADECLSKLEDCVAFDPGGDFPVGYSVTVLTLAAFDATNG